MDNLLTATQVESIIEMCNKHGWTYAFFGDYESCRICTNLCDVVVAGREVVPSNIVKNTEPALINTYIRLVAKILNSDSTKELRHYFDYDKNTIAVRLVDTGSPLTPNEKATALFIEGMEKEDRDFTDTMYDLARETERAKEDHIVRHQRIEADFRHQIGEMKDHEAQD